MKLDYRALRFGIGDLPIEDFFIFMGPLERMFFFKGLASGGLDLENAICQVRTVQSTSYYENCTVLDSNRADGG